MTFPKTLFFIAACCALTSDLIAGTDPAAEYRAAADRIKKEMAALPFPEFALRKVPELYRNESQVILADFTRLQAGAGRKKDWLLYREIRRTLVALQDEAAVRAWSERTYNEFNARNTGYGHLESRIVVGIRVLKADGRISEINPGEDEVRRRYSIGQGVRLAIPDLQAGDLLDIYTVRESEGEPANFGAFHYQYPLSATSPVLNRRIECETGPEFAAEFHNINGAPPFRTEQLAPKQWTLRFFTDSVSRRPAGLDYVNVKRQYPLLQLNVMRGDIAPYTSITRRHPGTMHQDPPSERFVWDELIRLSRVKRTILAFGGMIMRKKSSGVTAYYDSLTRGRREFDLDSLAADLYYMFRFDYAFNILRNMDAKGTANLSDVMFNSELFHYLLSEYFKLHGVKSELVIAAPLTEPPLKDVIDRNDFVMMTTVKGDHEIFFGSPSLFAPAFSTLQEIEGVNDAVAVDTRGVEGVLGSDFTTRVTGVPFTEADENVRTEQLSLVPDPECAGLRVARSTRLTGHQKDGIQDKLLTVDDFYDYERKYYKDERSLTDRVLERRDTETIAAELKAALAKARREQQKEFENEAKSWVCPGLTEIQQAAIRNPGTRHTDPVFEYSSRFRANELLRPAGNNFMLHIGQLIHHIPTVDATNRKRSDDAYLDFAKTYRSSYSVRVPQGFTPAGIEALNKDLNNDAGSFKATAVVDGNIITINLELICRKSIYAPGEWSQLVDVLEAAGNWKASRILFRRAS